MGRRLGRGIGSEIYGRSESLGTEYFPCKRILESGNCNGSAGIKIPYAAETLGAKKLEAYVVSSNTASLRSLEHHGFVVDRELRFSDLEGSLLVLEKELD